MNIREAVERLKSIPTCMLVEFDIPKGDRVVRENVYDVINHLKELEDLIFEGNLLLSQSGHSEEAQKHIHVLEDDLREGERFLDKYFFDNHALEPCEFQHGDEEEDEDTETFEYVRLAFKYVHEFIHATYIEKLEDNIRTNTSMSLEELRAYVLAELSDDIESKVEIYNTPMVEEFEEILYKIHELLTKDSFIGVIIDHFNNPDDDTEYNGDMLNTLAGVMLFENCNIINKFSPDLIKEHFYERVWNVNILSNTVSVDLQNTDFPGILEVLYAGFMDEMFTDAEIILNI